MAKLEWFQEWFHTGFKRLSNCRRLGDEMSLDRAALTGGRVFRRVVEAILYDRRQVLSVRRPGARGSEVHPNRANVSVCAPLRVLMRLSCARVIEPRPNHVELSACIPLKICYLT